MESPRARGRGWRTPRNAAIGLALVLVITLFLLIVQGGAQQHSRGRLRGSVTQGSEFTVADAVPADVVSVMDAAEKDAAPTRPKEDEGDDKSAAKTEAHAGQSHHKKSAENSDKKPDKKPADDGDKKPDKKPADDGAKEGPTKSAKANATKTDEEAPEHRAAASSKLKLRSKKDIKWAPVVRAFHGKGRGRVSVDVGDNVFHFSQYDHKKGWTYVTKYDKDAKNKLGKSGWVPDWTIENTEASKKGHKEKEEKEEKDEKDEKAKSATPDRKVTKS